MSDRTRKVVVYSEPVHYKHNGKWKDIDNTLIKEEKENEEDFGGYVNKENDFKVKIADNSEEENLVEISKDKYNLQFSLESTKNSDKKINKKSKKKNIYKGNKEKLKVNTTSETITYENVIDDIDIDYVVTSSGLKENIIVNKAQNKYDLKEKKDGYTLYIKADKKWINAEDRTFPVIIDPAITTETTKAAIASTFVASEAATTNYNQYKMLLVGRESSAYGKCRTFGECNIKCVS